ncbi:MAG TPA: glycosyltransferase family 4 protein [Acidimicrobiales bacterium]
MRAIHHFVPLMHHGDAVGRHTLRLRDAARASGFDSEIFVDIVQDDTAADTASILEYPDRSRGDDTLVYQFATASYLAEWLTKRSETLVVNYHNITPSELMTPWDPFVGLGQKTAEEELKAIATRTALAIADSAYNERHLIAAGFRHTAVVPPSAALATLTPRANPHTNATLGARWLSVGRLAPNKAVEDTITALAITRARHDPAATLLIIGKPATVAYGQALRRFVADMGLHGAITFAGFASDEAVAAAYAESDVLVVTSDHEGFCVPVVEAMAIGLPVVAFNQGAVPDVLGSGGLLIDSKDPYLLAAEIAGLLGDAARQRATQVAATQQLQSLALDTAADRFIGLVSALDVVGAST